MPDTERRRPRVATVEDYDEDAQTTLPGSRTSANVAIKRSQQELTARSHAPKSTSNGIDSRYATGTGIPNTEATTITRRKMPELKLDTAVPLERERQPYHMPHSAPAKPTNRRQSVHQSKDPISDQSQLGKLKYFVHDHGICWVCDQYGKHIDIKKEMSRASSVAPPPPSPKTIRQNAPRSARDDDALPDKSRRLSSSRQPRPLSMVNPPVPVQYVSPAVYAQPVVATSGWATPVTPSLPYNPVSYSYAPTSPLPGASFAPFQHMLQFIDNAPPSELHSTRPSRRPSPVRRATTYGDPVIRQTYIEPEMVGFEKLSLKENRSVLPSRRSARTIDDDRNIMPPPPPPQPKTQPDEVGLGRRPSARRSKTYHPSEAPLRERLHESDQNDDDDFDFQESRPPPSATRGRRESHSPSRPPTSYRGPSIVEARDRPAPPRKSVSYSTPTTTTKVASTRVVPLPRRTTIPPAAVPLEQKEIEAEQYQQSKSKTSSELTAQALRDFNKRTSSSRSEGSSYSHKSHQSSSKDSSGRGRSHTSGTRTSITLPGGLNMSIPADYVEKDGRPISVNVGGLVVSVSTEAKEESRAKEQKSIERAPSVTSRTSRKSVSSNVSNREPNQSSRRLSHIEDRVPSLKSSRQPSRAPSISGRSYEYTRRQSVDYGKSYQDAVYGA
ncbi:hypothetical protein LTS15_008000 [Exophiala xenobiotica]|nr:hypothetical protein LTS15_008000 [Exophiala xenobiotica]